MSNIWVLKRSREFNSLMELSKMKTVIIKYTASWCGPCRKINPKFIEFSNDYPDLQFAEIDIDKFSKISNEQFIKSIPTFLVYLDNDMIDSLTGSNIYELEKLIKSHA